MRFDAEQVLTDEEQTRARSNLGVVAAADIGDPGTDFLAILEAALAA